MSKSVEKNSNGRKRPLGRIRIILFVVLIFIIIGYFLAPKISDFISNLRVSKLTEEEKSVQSMEIPESYEVTQLTAEEAAALLGQVPIPETEAEDEEAESEEIQEPVSTEEIELMDVYAPSGVEVVFKRYHKDAESYIWEYYDLLSKSWVSANEEKITLITDELYRPVSIYKTESENHERNMIRCTIKLSDGREVVSTASLYTLPEIISGIQIKDYETEVNTYTAALSVPVTVIYESGNKEDITGLYGLHFLDVKESVEHDQSISGNKIEKQMTIITECDYVLASSEPKEITIRYLDGSLFEDSIKVTGKDKIAPVISELTIGDYVVSKSNQIVPVDICIVAEDNETPYPYLQYAFVHESKTPNEEDFYTDSKWTANIDRNGTWIAYVKDENGNLASKETVIFTVDQKAPSLKVEIKNETWCKNNVIIAVGNDKTELKYRISCDTQGMETDWSSDSSFTVEENGIYTVSAMDAAGNVTTEEITINNIDNNAPVIIGIKEVGGSYEK